MKNLCDDCTEAEDCLIQRLRLKVRDELRVLELEARLNGLEPRLGLAVDCCNKFESSRVPEFQRKPIESASRDCQPATQAHIRAC